MPAGPLAPVDSLNQISLALGTRTIHQGGLPLEQSAERISGSSSLLRRYDEPEILLCSTAPNCLKGDDGGQFYLSTVLDDFSRYIIAWKLCTTMAARDVTDTLELVLAASGCDQTRVWHRPRLLSDNGPSYVAGDLAEWLASRGMDHVRGAPRHPQTQGKIERWHQTLKNRVLLENHYLPGDPEARIEAFVGHYNHKRHHESLQNLTPADVYFGRGHTVLLERARIKRQTLQQRRWMHQHLAA